MPIRRLGPALFVFLLLAWPTGGAWAKAKDTAAAPGGPGFALLERVGSDPLLLWAMRADDLGRDLEALGETLGKFLPEAERGKLDAGLKQLDERLGLSFRNDFLSQLGPEIVFVLDLPPLDTLIGQVASGQPEGLSRALSGVGILSGVRDPQRFERALRRLLELGKATIRENEGIMEATLQAEGNAVPLKLTWSIRQRVLAFGLSPEWIASASTAHASGTRVTEGQDFARVASHLDARPATLFYLNLPKAARMVRESQFLQGMLSANPEGARTLNAFLAPEMTGMGLGYTSVRMGEGTRTSSFGPSWMSSGGMLVGIVAAVALPNFMTAMDRGKQKRTVADLEGAGTVLAAYALDHEDGYPVSEDWRPLGEVLPELPAKDGWGHALEYWSDGERYVIVSRGKDGETERDWRRSEGLGGARPAFEADIVLADGVLVAWPGEPE
jgi:hypothetical protein